MAITYFLDHDYHKAAISDLIVSDQLVFILHNLTIRDDLQTVCCHFVHFFDLLLKAFHLQKLTKFESLNFRRSTKPNMHK